MPSGHWNKSKEEITRIKREIAKNTLQSPEFIKKNLERHENQEWKQKFNLRVKQGWKKSMQNPAFKKKFSETKRKEKLMEKNPNWKADKVGYIQIHTWVKSRKLNPGRCESCGLINKKLDLAFNDHLAGIKTPEKYKRDLDFWGWLCRSCHMKLDGRILNLRRKK